MLGCLALGHPDLRLHVPEAYAWMTLRHACKAARDAFAVTECFSARSFQMWWAIPTCLHLLEDLLKACFATQGPNNCSLLLCEKIRRWWPCW